MCRLCQKTEKQGKDISARTGVVQAERRATPPWNSQIVSICCVKFQCRAAAMRLAEEDGRRSKFGELGIQRNSAGSSNALLHGRLQRLVELP